MPAPIAEISAWISVVAEHLVDARRSTFRILPRMGRIAWMRGLRASLADPPAQLPSTMKSSALRGIVRRAVGELAGQPGAVESALAPGEVARLARRLTRVRGLRRLRDDLAALVGVLLEPLGELLVGGALDERPDRGVAEFGLGLALELGLRSCTETIAVRPSRMSSPSRFSSFSFSWPLLARVAVDDVGEGLAEALLVHAAFGGRDAVRERVDALVEAGVPLERDLDLLAGLGLLVDADLANSDSLDVFRCVT